jgi:hypothetical protein
MSAINGTGVRASVHIMSASVVKKSTLYDTSWGTRRCPG